MNTSLSNGFDARNILCLDKKYKCLTCQLIVRNPVQIICGHRLCYSCLRIENNLVQCPKCSKVTSLSEIRLDKGFNNDMQQLPILCHLCEWSGDFNNYENHLAQLHQQYRCLFCNSIFTSAPSLQQHTESMCSQMLVDCVLQPYGCNTKILRCNQSEHYTSKMHQQILMLCTSQCISTLAVKHQNTMHMDTYVDRKRIDHSPKVTTDSSTILETDESNAQQKDVIETLNILAGGIVVLNDDVQRLSSESLQQSLLIEMSSQNLKVLKTSCEESKNFMDALSTNISILQQDCFSLKQKVEDSKSISYDGTLLWKISHVQEKMTDAQSERQVSIYSPPFYSSPTGYKMCARLYFYGDGNARRTHMSLFFVLMRSEHDALLSFPFTYKVTFCLFDQTGEQQHIIDTFRPDPKSSSFQKPRCDMNIASGIPKFVQLDKIQQPNSRYVKENVMFIKVMVDFANLHKTMLPYAVSLNPGLPISCQQRLIQQEIQQRAQLQSQKILETTSTNSHLNTNGNLSIGKEQVVDNDSKMS
ncbi:unnamed protein product [Rotaria magnacalcarata]|uniref:Uncharacterized protein n=2 Tax=Rotaria magnacalcarata TaxID=392030 RepID=A0A816K379_9BILA|nr:unnamed protein product [Rotaria magnacalcarata]